MEIFHVKHQAFLFALCLLFHYHSFALKIGETCSANAGCDSGLKCDTCAANGNTRPRCVRIQPLSPTSKVKDLPFNKYSWLTTHNSFARAGDKSATGSFLVTPMNQEDTVASQLNNGVRGLMLDMYDFMNDIWLCHSYGGKCYNYTAFKPAITILQDIKKFLEANPSEIVTIFIEDYVTSSQGLSKVFKAAGLTKYLFPISLMPNDGEDWPTVDDMVEKNQRLVVFTSKKNKEAEGFAYEWKYVVENQYGNGGMISGSCPNRSESAAMNTTSRSLVLQNYFPDNPNATAVCAHNSAPLATMLETCHKISGNRWPNFVAVDYYQKSDGGGAAQAVDRANGQLTCGCDSVAYCKEDSKFGTCDVPPISPPPPAATTEVGPAAPSLQNSSNANPFSNRPVRLHWLWGSVLAFIATFTF